MSCTSCIPNTKHFSIIRQGHKHTSDHGEQPVRHGWPANVHSGCRNGSQLGDSLLGHGSHGLGPESEFAGELGRVYEFHLLL